MPQYEVLGKGLHVTENKVQRLAAAGEVVELTEFAAAPLLGFRLKRHEPPKPVSIGYSYDVAVSPETISHDHVISEGNDLDVHSHELSGDVQYGKNVEATDGAVALAEEYGVDLSTVQGSGAGGRITKQDVRRAVGDA